MDSQVEKIEPEIDNDPEVLAEVKKNRILHLKLERWKETASAVGVVLQTFKAEAMSLISGVGTLVVGWFQIRKMVIKGRAEVKAEGTSEVRSAGRSTEKKFDRAEMAGGSGYGSGHGRLGGVHKPTRTTMAPPPPPGGELMVPPDTTAMESKPFMLDPMNYVTVGLPVIFVWSSILAWVKRKRKLSKIEGGQ
jgi:hypothetical protein